MNATSEVSLLMGVMRGRVASLADLYDRHSAVVYELACQLCGNHRANEVVRTVFLEVWRSPGSFASTTMSLRDHLLTGTLSAAAVALDDGGPFDVAPDGRWAILERLPAGEREAIALSNVAGLTYRDVAAMLHRPEDDVKRDIRTGLDRILTPDRC